MKKWLGIVAIFICGLAHSQSGIYVPVNPSTYGSNNLRIKATQALNLPSKPTLQLNTTDTTPQIFYHWADSSVWAWSRDKGYFKVGNGNGGGGGTSITAANSGTIAQLRAMTTTTGYIYFSTDFGGGIWLDLGLNDGVYSDDTAIYLITSNGHVLKRQFTAGRINASWFGVIGDGVTDDKIALQSSVTYAMNNGLELEITGKVRVTDQILITKAFKLIGVGSPSSDTVNKVATILFDNNQVDGSGNATKSLFKIDEPVLYKLYNLSFENLSIIHRNQTPKNQHTFYVNGSNVTFWNINNVTVYNATGAIIYLKDGGTQYTPYAQQINWKNIKGYNVGGFLSQNGTNTWFVGGTIDNVSLEQQINSVSPQPILCDFTGFLNITPRNIILEGNCNAAVTTCIKSTGHNMKFEDIWIEYVTNAPQYAFDIRSQTQLNHIVIAQGKIRAMGRFTAIDLTDLEVDQDVFNIIKLENGASITINKLYEQYTSDGLGVGTKYKINIPDSLVGRVKIKDAVSVDGGTYSHNRVVPLFSLTKGVPFRINQQINENFKVIPFGPAPSITSVLDSEEGRVLKLTPVSSNLDYLRFQVKVPPSFIGSSLTVGIRYKVEASNNTGNIKLLGLQSGGSSNGDNGVVPDLFINNSTVNVLDKRGTWENGYLIVGQISDSVIVFELAGYSGINTPHTIYISDLKVQLGQELPDLIGKVTDPVTWNDDQLPTSGYFVKGDIIYNTSPTDTTMGWRRLVTGLTNNIGTDWIEILPKSGIVDFSYGILGGISTVGGSFPLYSKETNTSIAENVIIGAPVGQERTGGNLLTIKNGNTVIGGIAAADGNLTLPHISAAQDFKVKNQYVVSEPFTPEGNVAAPVGSLAIQSSTGDLAIKKTGTGTTGWQAIAIYNFNGTLSGARATQPTDLLRKDQLDSAYVSSGFGVRNAGGIGDTLMNASKETNTLIYKRLAIYSNNATKAVDDTTITYQLNDPVSGTATIVGDGSLTSFTIPLSIVGLSVDSRVWVTPRTALGTGVAVSWVDVSDESMTVYFTSAPSSGTKTINYMIQTIVTSP